MSLTRSYQQVRQHSFWSAVKCSFTGFMTHTSMHGMRYVCEDGRRAIERAFFIVTISTFSVVASFMVINIYKRSSGSPIMTNIDRTHYPSWRLPFPGVTICNTNRILKSKAETFVDQLTLPYGLDKSQVLEDLKLLGQLREPEFPSNERSERLQKILDANRFTVTNVMRDLSPTCHELFEKCSWKGQIVNCTDLFEMRKSHIGFCCSFNHLGVKDQTIHRKRGKLLWKVEGEAVHTRLFGQRMGLSLLINPMTYEYFMTSFISAGLTLTIHDSEDYPDGTGTATEKMIQLEKEVLVPVTTSALFSDDDLRDLSPLERQCVFSDERSLDFFTFYNSNNCIAECKMKHYIKLCNCLPFYYPDDGTYSTCTLKDVDCIFKNFDTLHTWLDEAPTEKTVSDGVMICDCPAQCNHVRYHAEVSLGDFKAARHSVNPFFLTETNVTDRILLHVFLESNFARVYKRGVINTWVDLLSYLGGVTSLFLGCSFVTVIELVYFFTIRCRRTKISAVKHRDCPFTPPSIRDIQVQGLSANK